MNFFSIYCSEFQAVCHSSICLRCLFLAKKALQQWSNCGSTLTTSWIWAFVPSRSITKAMKHNLNLNRIICHYLLPWKGTSGQFYFLEQEVTFELLIHCVTTAIVSISDFFPSKNYNLLRTKTVLKTIHVKIFFVTFLYHPKILWQLETFPYLNNNNCPILWMLQWNQVIKVKHLKKKKKIHYLDILKIRTTYIFSTPSFC